LVAAAKVLAAATKHLFVVPNFVAVTKPFCPVFDLYSNFVSLILTASVVTLLRHSSKRRVLYDKLLI